MRAHLALAVVLTASLGLSACSGTADTRRGMTSAAMSPLRDVGLVRPEIPLVLRGLEYPYATISLADGCPSVAREIAGLDAVLGPESYQPGPNRNIWDRSGDFIEEQAIDAVADTASDLIPFRSWVRRISGASRAERDALRAVANGQQRRTFLRGYGASLGCPAMIPPPPPQPAREGGEPQPIAQEQPAPPEQSPAQEPVVQDPAVPEPVAHEPVAHTP